jgi:hypothetical protein
MKRRIVVTILLLVGIPAISAVAHLPAQQSNSAYSADPKEWTTAEDHQNMMSQLGIRKLRPGPSGNENAPNSANCNEAKANPYPNLPEILTLRSGKKATTADMWWNQRRPEIVEDFEREVYGRIPQSPRLHGRLRK